MFLEEAILQHWRWILLHSEEFFLFVSTGSSFPLMPLWEIK